LKSTILLARDFGGPEIGVILRNLSINYREKESALNEIATRQSWIKNGAMLASLTPWILLVILSFHPQTISAYNSNSGRAVLLVGLVLTVIAYKWITRISQSVLSR
jgi:tight adherence protein B